MASGLEESVVRAVMDGRRTDAASVVRVVNTLPLTCRLADSRVSDAELEATQVYSPLCAAVRDWILSREEY